MRIMIRIMIRAVDQLQSQFQIPTQLTTHRPHLRIRPMFSIPLGILLILTSVLTLIFLRRAHYTAPGLSRDLLAAAATA